MTKLEEYTERLRLRNDSLAAHLGFGSKTMVERVADAPEMSLEEVTERARKYWDSKEKTSL